MSIAPPARGASPVNGEGMAAWVAAGAVVAAAIIGVAVALETDTNIVLLLLLPFAIGGAATVLWSTRLSLFLVAFAIFPLGVVQREVIFLTISLPEALILILFAKEFLRFVLTAERPSRMVPWVPLLLYIGASIITIGTGLMRGNQPAGVLQDFRQFTEYVTLFLLITHRLEGRRDTIVLLFCFVSGGVLIALHGIAQRYTGLGIPGTQLMSDLVYHGAVRSGSFYGSTPLGAIMVLCLGPAIGLMLTLKSRLLQAILGSMAVILVVAAVFTNTRASWIAIAILLVYVFLAVRKTRTMIAVATVGAVGIGAVLGPVIIQRLSTLEFSRTERSLLERVDYYTTAKHIFTEFPILGMGWGSYYSMANILVNDVFVHRDPVTRPGHMYVEPVTVHSAYLQLLVKGGLLMLLSFGVFVLRWLWLLWCEYRTRPRDEADHNLFIGVSAALVGYLFHTGVENFFQWPVMAQAFWLLMGVSFVLGTRILEQGRPSPAAGPVPAGQ